MSDWQEISSAPTGETDLVALWNGKIVTCGARWEGGFADWFHDWIEPQPTHWQPLPAPPEAPIDPYWARMISPLREGWE